MKQLRFRLMTPKSTLFDDDVGFVLLRTTKGDMGILPGHAPYAALLAEGMLRIFAEKQELDAFRVYGGTASVQDNVLTVLTPFAGRPEELEALLAEQEEARSQRRLREAAANLEMHRAEEALRRALVHLEVSADAILKGHEEKE